MSEYRAPVREMLFVMNELANLREINQLPGYEEATPDLIEAVLEEASQLAAEVIAPTNRIGDATGTRVENSQVRVAAEFAAAYRQFVDAGWAGLAMNPDFGGQGLPILASVAVEEMWQSANLAWSLCPLLTHGAVHAIEMHGSEELRARYLPKMVSGEWTGTMNLSEPQAGSDLGAIRTQAVPDGDGAYRLSGQKIFITWGDHDMTGNVIHLVLARLQNAPDGSRGLSLFLVPRNLPDDDGNPGGVNGVKTVSVEHKLGIHGSPTCVLSFEDAVGYLIGEENQGLACMFTMMNRARLSVGLEGVSVPERAYQQAVEHAVDRVQGGEPGHQGKVTIIHHPDVRRMLLEIKSQIEAMRSVAYVTAAELDFASRAPDAERGKHQARVDLLTPVVKGWSTETGQQLTSIALQVHGGTGYIEEAGVAQHYRDARIMTIYEGTTGIQANDLVRRKILRDGGQAMTELLADMETVLDGWNDDGDLQIVRDAHAGAVGGLRASLGWLLANHDQDVSVPGAVSFNLLMQFGIVAGGWQMARAAKIASAKLSDGSGDADYYRGKIMTARFYAEQILPRADACACAVRAGSETIMAFSEEQFFPA